MSFFNQYSYLITSLFVTGIIAIFLLHDGIKRRDVIAIGAIAATFVGVWFFTRPLASNLSQDQIELMLKSGKPTLIEFQSEY